jgi:hypothetical protein
MGHVPHSSKLIVICVVLLLFLLFYLLLAFVFFYVLFVCKCLLYHCHRVMTQLQLTNISYQFNTSYKMPKGCNSNFCIKCVTYPRTGMHSIRKGCLKIRRDISCHTDNVGLLVMLIHYTSHLHCTL